MSARAVAQQASIVEEAPNPLSVYEFPKSPTPEIVAAIKQAAAEIGLGDRLYKFELDGQVVVFRPLMRQDWNEILTFLNDSRAPVNGEMVDHKICEKVILWPQPILHPVNWERQKAGLQVTLAQYVRDRSGFINPDPNVDQSTYLNFDPLHTPTVGEKPTPEVIERLKLENPSRSLRLAFVVDEYYVIRPLSRGEWKKLTSVTDELDSDLLVSERGVVWSKDYPNSVDFDTRLAGVVQTISQAVMNLSGFLTAATVEEL